ncbi:MAG: peptidase M75 [Proteobacteria bacterium]|nr:peptidase M75 [Pseudomonadota bacterium]
MKNLYKCSICLMLLLSACGGGSSNSDNSNGGGSSGIFSSGGATAQRVAIDNYVNNFIVPTLTSLDNNAGNLLTAVRNLVSNPTAENLSATKAAWVATRIPWENSESALFGPVDFYGFDPAMDSWPVNKTDLESVISSGTALTKNTVASFDNSLKGFHTIEYLIYGDNGSKAVGALTAREMEYLLATTEALKDVTSSLLASWVDGFAGQSPYAEEVVKAGQGSSTFVSEGSAIEQFVRGIVGICDEVANGKIADPFDQRNPNIVESQFSGNSLTDFRNNIIGARTAYTSSVSALVLARNTTLDASVRTAFEQAINAIDAIPETFLLAIQDSNNDAVIENAQAKIRALQNLIEGEVLPIVIN